MINEGNKVTDAHALIINFAEAAQKHKLIVSGPLYKIGALNKNEWGIPRTEVDNILNSIVGNPLKICSSEGAATNEHSCDYAWDPRAEIGKVTAAKVEGDWIHATAEVTDPIAAQKIIDGTWPRSWSGFLTHRASKSKGWLPHIRNKAITIVRNPAYENAGYTTGTSQSFYAKIQDMINKGFNDPEFQAKLRGAAHGVTESNEAAIELEATLYKINNKFKGAKKSWNQ
ncbi:Uncharacterised protein [uncultured archaeon]|nr:Uncharacterised protein [uncultured archaeon]